MTSKAEIVKALEAVKLPDGRALAGSGLLSEIVAADGKVFFSLTVPAADAPAFETVRAAAERAVKALPGVTSAIVALTAERAGGATQASAPSAPTAGPRTVTKPSIPGIRHIIAVASGKGGVGKSTTAINLALALSEAGMTVGILDADVYGPSLPRLIGVKDKPRTVDGRRMMPLEAWGLKAMSMGFLVDEDTPMVWRGPMVMSALGQMLRDVEWGELDVLVIDMPPGTGDAQLTIAQQVPLAGAVIVSTPQDLALIDARKGIAMFRKVDVPILGIIENMSYFVAPDTGKRYDIFGHGGAKAEADRIGVPFLGEVPLMMEIRESSDDGKPCVINAPDGAHAGAYRLIGNKVAEMLDANAGWGGPTITFE